MPRTSTGSAQRLLIVYSSTSGHTEYVIDVLVAHLKAKQAPWEITVQNVEQTETKQLLECNVLLLASSTWNSTEGLLPPDFDVFTRKDAKDIDLAGKPTCVIGLGDTRYRNTGRATLHLMTFLRQHNGKNLLPPLPIMNEPYDQDAAVQKWGDKLLEKLSSLSST